MNPVSTNELEIYIDGASKGNPGHSGIGVVILQGNKAIRNMHHYIGQATNNIAEYTALIYALQEALLLKADSIRINTDSQLLHRQLNKTYKVRDPGILCLYNQAVHLMSGFKNININHISREHNKVADKLATKAVKEALATQGQPVL